MAKQPQNISIIHTTAGMAYSSGGTSRVVRDLTDYLSIQEGCSVRLVSQGAEGENICPIRTNSMVNQEIALSKSSRTLSSGLPFRRALLHAISVRRPSIIHDHGIWTLCNHYAASAAGKSGVPLMLHPHGMLEPWAMSYHSHKKKLAWLAYQRKDLASAALLFATAESEADAIRNLGFTQPIAIIPNGVELPEYTLQHCAPPTVERTRTVVFMSRIHPKKGLINLIDAWGQLRPTGWKLTLAGPDEGGHLQEVMARVTRHGLASAVEYRGAVEGEAKAALLKGADVFILPSFSENFGVVVGEALAYGVPVISTVGTPWKGLVDNKCGWWVKPEANALAAALSEAVAMSDEDRREMGVRGQSYARQFNWSGIARDTANVYRWLLGQADRPSCVRLD